jgi:predicted GIY-YIG superfamily endonuclease
MAKVALYVLYLEGNRMYVGTSGDPWVRVESHKWGTGAKCVAPFHVERWEIIDWFPNQAQAPPSRARTDRSLG